MQIPFFSQQGRLTKAPRRNCLSRQMRGFEQLEDRRVLATIPVTLMSDTANPVNDGAITLREAIRYVNGENVPLADRGVFDYANLGTNDTIVFAPGLSGDIYIDPIAGKINITSDVTITGQVDAEGNNKISLDGQGHSIIFWMMPAPNSPGPTVSISKLDFKNGNGANYGAAGAIFVRQSECTVTHANFTSNEGISGGAIALSESSSGSLSNVTFESNTGVDSGAISISASRVEIDSCEFRNNHAVRPVGAQGGGGGERGRNVRRLDCVLSGVLSVHVASCSAAGSCFKYVPGVSRSSTAWLMAVMPPASNT